MTKIKAHVLLDRIRSGEARFVSLAETNQALEQTGDICGLFSQSLRAACEEPRNHRTRQIHEQTIPTEFSYSAYLDKTTTESIK